MYVPQLIVSVIVLLALLWSAKKSYLLHATLLFVLFYFASVAFDLSSEMTTFYLFGVVFSMILTLYLKNKARFQADSSVVPGVGTARGAAHEVFSVVLAVFLFFAAAYLSSSKGQIMGVASLAVESTNTLTSQLTLIFAPAMSGALGFIENMVFFGIFFVLLDFKEFFSFILGGVVALIPFLGPVLAPIISFLQVVGAFVVVPFLFAVFHVIAYLFDWGKLLFAALMMALMIGAYYVNNKDITPANLFHYGWNNIITSKEALSIAL